MALVTVTSATPRLSISARAGVTWDVEPLPAHADSAQPGNTTPNMLRMVPPPEQQSLQASAHRVNGGKRCSHVEPEQHHVAVLDDVIAAFLAHLAGVLRPLLAVARDVIVVRDRLGADEAALEVGMDGAGGFGRRGAAPDGPGARLLRPGGEERDQVEQRVPGADPPRQAGLGEPEAAQEFAALALGQLCHLG